MMIVMREGASAEQVDSVVRRVESVGARAHVSEGEIHTVIGAIGDREQVANLELEGAPGVDHVVPISRPYKLASNEFRRGEVYTEPASGQIEPPAAPVGLRRSLGDLARRPAAGAPCRGSRLFRRAPSPPDLATRSPP